MCVKRINKLKMRCENRNVTDRKSYCPGWRGTPMSWAVRRGLFSQRPDFRAPALCTPPCRRRSVSSAAAHRRPSRRQPHCRPLPSASRRVRRAAASRRPPSTATPGRCRTGRRRSVLGCSAASTPRRDGLSTPSQTRRVGPRGLNRFQGRTSWALDAPVHRRYWKHWLANKNTKKHVFI